MKILIWMVAFLLAMPVEAQQKKVPSQIMGSWSGKLNVGISSLTVVIHLEEVDGDVKVTMDRM